MVKKFASVQFDPDKWSNSKNYQFVTDIEDLKMGDVVVVHTKNGYKIATFQRYETHPMFESPKWIVQKVDVQSHVETLKKESKRKEIKKKMEERRKQVEEIQIYRILAKDDEDMRNLLEEYEEFETITF